MNHTAAFEQICQDARARVREITIAEVRAKLDANASFHFIDVREDNEIGRAHV